MGWARQAGKVGIAAGVKLLVKQTRLWLVIAESSWGPVALAQLREGGEEGGWAELGEEEFPSEQSAQVISLGFTAI